MHLAVSPFDPTTVNCLMIDCSVSEVGGKSTGSSSLDVIRAPTKLSQLLTTSIRLSGGTDIMLSIQLIKVSLQVISSGDLFSTWISTEHISPAASMRIAVII